MFTEPLIVTTGTDEHSLARIGFVPGKFQTASGDTTITISHAATKNGRIRSIFRLDRQIVVEDPLSASVTRRVKDTAYVVMDSANSATGITADERIKTLQALTVLAGGSWAAGKFVGGES